MTSGPSGHVARTILAIGGSLLVAAAAIGCRAGATLPQADTQTSTIVDVSGGLTENIRDGRASRYDPALDYFPDKVSFDYTRQVQIEYHRHYKVLTIVPAPNPSERFQYVLVQRGTPAPPVSGRARVIEVPVGTLALTHEELLGAAEILGLHDRLVAVSGFGGVRLPGLRALIDRGKLAAVGSGKHVDVERLISLSPDLVMTYWSISPDYSAHPVLDQAGIRTVILASHWETSGLATAEWMKVMAVLFNRERRAGEEFGAIARRYEALAARARAEPDQPLVLTRLPFRHIWSVGPAPDEITNAGGRYFWPGETRNKGVDAEAVIDRAREAAAWVIAFPTPMRTQDDLLAREPRLSRLRAVQTGQVWNWDLQETQRGRPAVDRRMRPDLVLADLVKILHPSLVPDHDFVFYRRLDPVSRPFAPAERGTSSPEP